MLSIKRVLILAVVCTFALMLMIPTVHAQEGDVPPLTETFTASDNSVAFDYPASWTVEEQDSYGLLTAPNGVTTGISASPLDYDTEGIDNLVVDRVLFFLDIAVEELPAYEIGDIIEFTVNGEPAARVDLIAENTSQLIYITLTLPDDFYATITVIGDVQTISDIESILVAVLSSIRIPGSINNENSIILTQTYSAPDTALTFDYPEGWFTFGAGGQIVLTNSQTVLDSGLEQLAEGDIVIIVLGSLSDLPPDVLPLLNDTPTPMDVVAAIADVLVQDASALTHEKIVVGGRSAAISYGTDGTYDLFDVAKHMPDGEIITLITLLPLETGRTQESVILAIAATMRLTD